jgi:hypothetical protein
MPQTSRTASVLAALTALIAAAVATPAAARVYPPLGLYGSIKGDGYPYVKPGGALDTLEIGRASRFGEVVLDVNPISPYRPDIAAAFRARNPNIKLLAYIQAQYIWNVADADSLNQIPTVIRRTVRDLNGFLYDRTGLEYAMLNINFAKKGSNGQFLVAEAMAAVVRDRIIATGTWNGLFTDIYCHGAGWTQGATGKLIDYQRAGYATLADLDLAWAAACDTFASRVRLYGGPNFTFVGNCGPSVEHAWCDGWMRENFPWQQGGSWTSNMLGDVASRGYFRDGTDYRQPADNWIFTAANIGSNQEYQPSNTTAARYGLASAALGEGVHTIGASSRRVEDAPYQDWWYDEYAVDLTTGRSSPMVQHTGWLGAPAGPAYTQVWPGTSPDAITNTNFETDVTSGWTFHVFAPAAATLSRDASTAGLGAASMKVHITASNPVDYYVYLNSVGQLSLLAGNSYSATFRCKASTPRNIHVMAGNSGGQAYIAVDNVWRNYQAVMTPTTSMTASLAFFIGNQTGDVWFDDVHFQQGASSVWRRDFQNGIVLVNPSDRTLSVPLELAYRRILGTHATTVNNGLNSTLQSIPAHDAVFLLRGQIDDERPSAIDDLRTGP